MLRSDRTAEYERVSLPVRISLTKLVVAIEPTEYLGLALVYGALAITVSFLAVGRPLRRTG